MDFYTKIGMLACPAEFKQYRYLGKCDFGQFARKLYKLNKLVNDVKLKAITVDDMCE